MSVIGPATKTDDGYPLNQAIKSTTGAATALTCDLNGNLNVSNSQAINTFTMIASNSVNNTNLKTVPGTVTGYSLSNTTGTNLYVKFFNKASPPAAGTDVPIWTILVPANGTANVGLTFGIPFSLGIGFAITTNPAALDNTLVAANSIILNVLYN